MFCSQCFSQPDCLSLSQVILESRVRKTGKNTPGFLPAHWKQEIESEQLIMQSGRFLAQRNIFTSGNGEEGQKMLQRLWGAYDLSDGLSPINWLNCRKKPFI